MKRVLNAEEALVRIQDELDLFKDEETSPIKPRVIKPATPKVDLEGIRKEIFKILREEITAVV